MPVIYGLKACDTCKKAQKALGFELIDVRANPLERAQLEQFFAAFGDALVNRASTTWRGLDEAARAGDPLDLIAAHPALMKRPVIEVDGTLYLGWRKDVQAALLSDG